MSLSDFLLGAFVYLASAVIAAPLAVRMGVSSVLGYLLLGIVIGPALLNLTGHNTQEVMHFAEFGVIVMLFLVGLELRPSKLWQLRKPILGLGGLQMGLTTVAIGLVAYALGQSWQAAVSIGLILALSSTALVMQNMEESGQLKTVSGQASFSVLLFQDISVIAILAFLPLIAPTHAGAVSSTSLIVHLPLWGQTLCVLGAVVLVVVCGRYLIPPLFRIISKNSSHEIFVGLALLIVVGITLLMDLVGLSPALGTFLAGVLLSDSEYRHELEIDLAPFRGLLLAVFFLSVGAGIDFSLLIGQPLTMLSLLVGYIVIKLIVLYLVARIFGLNRENSTRFAFNLAQGGEFAFVLITFCIGLSILGTEQAALLVALVALSMTVSPLLTLSHDRFIVPLFGVKKAQRQADEIDQTAAVIIAGYGRFGMMVGRLLQMRGHATVILDYDAEQIEALRRFGYRVYYGDASRLDLLQAAGARDAKILVIAIDDPERSKITNMVRMVREQFPHLRIFVRAYDRVHAYELLNLGVEDVYREVFGSSTDMGRDVLTALGTHPYAAERMIQAFKKHDEKIVRESAQHSGDDDTIIGIIRRGSTEFAKLLAKDATTPMIENESNWHGQTAAETASESQLLSAENSSDKV